MLAQIIKSLEKLMTLETESRYIRLSSEIRNKPSIFKKIIHLLEENPGHPYLVSKILNISKEAIYRAAYSYCIREDWSLGSKKGNRAYLSKKFFQTFVDTISSLIANNECPTSNECLDIIHELRQEMYKEALEEAKSLKLTPIINRFNVVVEPPDISTVYKMAKKAGFHFLKPSEISTQRRNAACRSNIRYWFENIYTEDFHKLFHIKLIFNADEASVRWQDSKKVLTSIHRTRSITVPTENVNSHISVMITFSSYGETLPPFIIIGGISEIPNDLQTVHDNHKSYITTSSCGFMDRKIFYQYAEYFISWLLQYKATNCIPIDAQTCLFIDSHTSRGNHDALKLFQQNHITVITFPGGITHIIQPFDVGIASSFKAHIRKLIRRYKSHFFNIEENSGSITLSIKRKILIYSIIDSAYLCTSNINIINAFCSCGLIPYDLSKILKSPYVLNDDHDPIFPNGRFSKHDKISGRILTYNSAIEALTPQ